VEENTFSRRLFIMFQNSSSVFRWLNIGMNQVFMLFNLFFIGKKCGNLM